MKKKIYAVLFSSLLLLTSYHSNKVFAKDEITFNRLGGNNRYETNLQIIKKGWTSSDTVVICTGSGFSDALCAAPLAKKYDAPILLTEGKNLNSDALSTLKAMNTKNAIIIAGPAVISTDVENELKGIGIESRRIYGQTRFETSTKIFEELGAEKEVFVVSSDNFPDSLSISPVAAEKQAPILLVSNNNSAASNNAVNLIIDKQNIKSFIIGGEGAVGSDTASKLPNSERISGKDRYETNIAVLKRFSDELDFSNLYISTGGNFPDSISGTRLASLTNSPIMFTTRKPSDTIKQLFNEKRTSIKSLTALGGDSAVRDYTISNLLYDTPITQNEAEPVADAELTQISIVNLDAKYVSLDNKITSYLKAQSGTYGVYFINLLNGASFGYNENTAIRGASTVKVPINLYVYELRRRGTISGDTKYQYLSSDYETGTGSLQYSKPGGYYTVKELSNKSIRISDNVAINILLTNVKGDDFYNYIGNIVGHSITPWKNYWSSKDLALIMGATYNFSNANSALGSEFLGNLEHTIFNDRINRYLPGVTVAHKIGNQVRVMNDVGIVYAKQPYVVAFMSSNVNESTACEVIGQASKMIYDFVQNN